MSYRTTNFRDSVLWVVATKINWNPDDENFLTGGARALVRYINSWVRKQWDTADFPEWASIVQRQPDAFHNVPYDVTAGFIGTRDAPIRMNRVLKVYLANPEITPGPIDTPFRLQDRGIHVGFEHGTTVWIKAMPPSPIFTSEPWNPIRNYQKGELTYSPISGECYYSLVNANAGNNPANTTSFQRDPPPPPPLVAEKTQSFVPAQPAVAGTSEIWSARVDVPNIYQQAGLLYLVRLTDENGILYTFNYTTPGAGGTVADLLAGLSAAITGLPASLTGMIITTDEPTATLTLELTTATFSLAVQSVTSLATVHFPLTHPSSYFAGIAAAPVIPLKTTVYLNTINESLPTNYVLNLLDATGVEHIVTYTAPGDQPLTDTVTALQDAVNTAALTDPFWGSVVVTAAPGTSKAFDISSPRIINIQATAQPAIQIYWMLIPFPLALADAVVRGAYADALREEGQTDKAAVEEQAVAGDTAISTARSVNQPYNPLTDQVNPKSRYKVEI